MTDKQDNKRGDYAPHSKCIFDLQMYFLDMRKLPNHHRNLMIVDTGTEIVCSFHLQLSSIQLELYQNYILALNKNY